LYLNQVERAHPVFAPLLSGVAIQFISGNLESTKWEKHVNGKIREWRQYSVWKVSKIRKAARS